MAKRRRRKFNLRMVRVNGALTVGALDTLDVTAGAVTSAAADKLRFVSLHASYSWTGVATIDDGAVFGLAHSDYSAAEIEECLEAVGAIDLGDKVAQEQANRLVREIGTLSGPHSVANGGVEFNDGKPVKTKLNWLMSAGDTLSMWVRNASGVIYTSGSQITIAGKLWVKD